MDSIQGLAQKGLVMSARSSQDAKADLYWQGALLVASDRFSMAEASRQLGWHEETLGRFSRDHSPRWKALIRRARKVLRTVDSVRDGADGVPAEQEEILRESASLKKRGVGWRQTAKEMNMSLGNLERTISKHEGFWKELCRSLGMADPRRASRGISDRTRDDIWRGFKMVAEEKVSRREASRRLGRGPEFLANCVQKQRKECRRACREYGVPLRGKPGKVECPTPTVRNRLDRAALIVASGVTLTQSARRLGITPANLIGNLKVERNLEYFEQQRRAAAALLGIPSACTQQAVLVSESGEKVLIGDDGTVVKRATGQHFSGRGLMSPRWDSKRGQLRWGRACVRKVGLQARNIRLIFDAFEELGWPPSMDDPLPGDDNDAVTRLKDTVKTLNRGLRILRFRIENGHRILWELDRK